MAINCKRVAFFVGLTCIKNLRVKYISIFKHLKKVDLLSDKAYTYIVNLYRKC